MTRNLKALGLALVAMLAMGAIAASGASAAAFDSEEKHTILEGTSEEKNNHVFTAGGQEVVCTHATFEGTTTEKQVTEITIEPTYKTTNCTAFGFANVHIKFNQCAYVFTANGEVELECKNADEGHKGEAVEITPTFFGFSVCTVKVYPGEYSGVTYKDVVNGDITVEADVEGITYEQSSGDCGLDPTTGDTATYTGNAIVEGKDSGGNPVDLNYTE